LGRLKLKLSIIIPVYNERKTIDQILKKIENINIRYIEKEIIIVDDFSVDGTRDILKKIKKHKVYYHDKNYGKGSAVKTGFRNASGEIILIQDADLEYEPGDYNKILEPILNNNAQIVYGSRFLNKKYRLFGKNRTILPTHLIGNKLLSFFTGLLYNSKVTDMETCYKVFKKDVLNNIKIKSRRFDFEPEFTAKVLKKGYKIIEVPIQFNARGVEEGKKITVLDGIKALFVLIKYRIID
jgi:glycosyltransferase involved in cell wall biosynthesis